MVSEEPIYERQNYDISGTRKRPFRRKRKFQGASWTPRSMSADKDDGQWCRRCRKFHGYMTMGIGYEKRQTSRHVESGEPIYRWVIMWKCPVSGDVVGERYL